MGSRLCKMRSAFLTLLAASLTIAIMPRQADAADLVKVGTAIPGSFSFMPLNIGQEVGIFQNDGIDVQIIGFSGGTKMHQALAANTLDVGFGSGPQMILTAKGSPMMAVAEMARAPANVIMIVPYNSPIKTLDDLDGKKIGVSGLTSLSAFTAREMTRGKDGSASKIQLVAIGGTESAVVSALRTGQVDAITYDLLPGLQLEKVKEARIVANAADYIPHFITHAIYAQNDIMANRPDVLKRFLAGWFQTIAFMKANKEATIKLTSKISGSSEEFQELEYDKFMPAFFSPDGHFAPEDVAGVAESLKVIEGTDGAPDLSKLYTEKFLPAPGG